jgi:beta-glucuronidase
MIRHYRQHHLRRVVELDGVWDFAFLGAVDPQEVNLSELDFPDRMPVPGCWDATPAYAGKRGLAAYRTRIFVPDAGPHRLIFNGVNNWCQVYLGGALLTTHSGGFTRFQADFSSQAPGEAELVVLVDNSFNEERSPLHLPYFDWYHYGGIARPVELHRLGDTWVNAVWTFTEDYQQRRVCVTVDYGAVKYPGWADLTILFNGESVLSERIALEKASGSVTRTLIFPEAELWSPASPTLHDLHVILGSDDQRERIGIRQVQVSGKEILINGKAERLLGFCRHESHPQFGCALPDALLVTDIQQLRDLGVNFVRGSHYPQDPRFLDLCDEAGICVWNEVIGWQHTAEHLTNPHFLEAQHVNAAEMVTMSYNHPAVILYGLLNESHSNDPTCRPGYESIIGVIRTLDSTRPVTYASNHPLDDVCLDLIDVVSVNTYPGWYVGEIEEIPETLDRILAHVDETESRGKPVIISEIGAEGIYGWRDWNETRWTEQYQARLHDTVIRHLFIDRERVCGLSLWLFGDFRSSEEVRRIMGRGRGFNNKGVVDEYRRPKESYRVVKEHFHKLNG